MADPDYPGIRTTKWKIHFMNNKKSPPDAKVQLLNLKILSLTAYDDDDDDAHDDNNNNNNQWEMLSYGWHKIFRITAGPLYCTTELFQALTVLAFVTTS
jgi:hypothetical protein